MHVVWFGYEIYLYVTTYQVGVKVKVTEALIKNTQGIYDNPKFSQIRNLNGKVTRLN